MDSYTDERLSTQIRDMMSFHPANAEKHQPERYKYLREQFIALSDTVNSMCPNGRAKSIALAALEEGLMRSTQAIAVGEDT